ncbi:MAG: sulfatase [Planctomycetota bacterium]
MRRLLAILFLLCGLVIAQDSPGTQRRPNILFAMADDWGWPHAGAYGDTVVATPNFDRIAREGVLFDNAFVSCPSCTASRNAILTGQEFWRLGEGANLHSTLDVAQPTFMRLLRDSGYEIGHWRKAWGPGDFKAGGYQEDPCGPGGTFDKFLAKRDPEKPFCFWFGTSDPHRGYEPGSGAKSGIDLSKVKVPGCWPDTPEVRSDIADYYFEVQRWDRDIGEALQLLEQQGLLDDTIVVVTGDHGMPFPRGKGNLYDLGTHVPLAVRWGRVASPGRREKQMVSLTDLAPTFLAAAGVERPPVMTGFSLLSVLDGSPANGPTRGSVVFGRERHTPAQAMPSLVGYPSRAIRTDKWLLIVNLEPGRWPAGVPEGATHPIGRFADCDDGPTKKVVAACEADPKLYWSYQACFGKRPRVELYDCVADPDQLHDLAGELDLSLQAALLQKELFAQLKSTGDPRFTDAAVRFDDYPYRAGYLQKHIERWRKDQEGKR